MANGPSERATMSLSQIVAEFEAAGRPVPPGLRQQAEAEQSGDWRSCLDLSDPLAHAALSYSGKELIDGIINRRTMNDAARVCAPFTLDDYADD